MPVDITNYNQFGLAYEFGIDQTEPLTVSGMAVTQITITATPEFEAFAKNSAGATAAYVRGKDKYEFSASGFLVNEAAFVGFTDLAFEYAGHYFIINKRETADSNEDFRKCSMTGVAFALITSPA